VAQGTRQMAFSLLMFWIMMLSVCRSCTVTPHEVRTCRTPTGCDDVRKIHVSAKYLGGQERGRQGRATVGRGQQQGLGGGERGCARCAQAPHAPKYLGGQGDGEGGSAERGGQQWGRVWEGRGMYWWSCRIVWWQGIVASLHRQLPGTPPQALARSLAREGCRDERQPWGP